MIFAIDLITVRVHFVKYLSRLNPQLLIKYIFISIFKIPEHNGMGDWRVTLIDRADNRKELRRLESFWQYKLNTFFPHGLNERNVPGEHD